MTRDECIEFHHKLHAISLEFLKNLKKLPMPERQIELANMTAAFGDLMYNEIGIEPGELDAATERLGLEKDDKEYDAMCREYT